MRYSPISDELVISSMVFGWNPDLSLTSAYPLFVFSALVFFYRYFPVLGAERGCADVFFALMTFPFH